MEEKVDVRPTSSFQLIFSLHAPHVSFLAGNMTEGGLRYHLRRNRKVQVPFVTKSKVQVPSIR